MIISIRLSDKSEAHSSCTMVLNDRCQSINQFFKNNEKDRFHQLVVESDIDLQFDIIDSFRGIKK